jgi:hypothetical protein
VVFSFVANDRTHDSLTATEFGLSSLSGQSEYLVGVELGTPLQRTNGVEALPTGVRPNNSHDFIEHLPKTFAPDHLMAVMERARLDHGVALGRVHLEPRLPEPGQLSTTELSFSLKGAYPSIKALLADLTARCPELTLVRLNLRHANGAQQVEAELSLRAWARPASLDAPAAAERH